MVGLPDAPTDRRQRVGLRGSGASRTASQGPRRLQGFPSNTARPGHGFPFLVRRARDLVLARTNSSSSASLAPLSLTSWWIGAHLGERREGVQLSSIISRTSTAASPTRARRRVTFVPFLGATRRSGSWDTAPRQGRIASHFHYTREGRRVAKRRRGTPGGFVATPAHGRLPYLWTPHHGMNRHASPHPQRRAQVVCVANCGERANAVPRCRDAVLPGGGRGP
jgi:hypothetical protein